MNSISPQETDDLQIYNIFVIYNFFNQKIAKYLNNQMTENLEYRFAKEYFTSLAERYSKCITFYFKDNGKK